MGSAPSTASVLWGVSTCSHSRVVTPVLVVRVEAILIPIFLLESKLGRRHRDVRVHNIKNHKRVSVGTAVDNDQTRAPRH
jgi:hypothetical protein